jgi:hypothetical protein
VLLAKVFGLDVVVEPVLHLVLGTVLNDLGDDGPLGANLQECLINDFILLQTPLGTF